MSSLRRIATVAGMVAFAATACSDDPVAPGNQTPAVATYDSDVAVQWFSMYLDLTRVPPAYTPPVASRTFGYAGVALYEALRPGMEGYRSLAGQINALSSVPVPEYGDRYHWPATANACLAAVARLYYPTVSQQGRDAIDALEADILADYTGVVDEDILARPVSQGISVANHVYAWSVSDRGHEGWTRNAGRPGSVGPHPEDRRQPPTRAPTLLGHLRTVHPAR